MYSLPHNPIICFMQSFLDLADVAILAIVSALNGSHMCTGSRWVAWRSRPDPDNSTRFISNLQSSSLILPPLALPFSTHIYFAARRRSLSFNNLRSKQIGGDEERKGKKSVFQPSPSLVGISARLFIVGRHPVGGGEAAATIHARRVKTIFWVV